MLQSDIPAHHVIPLFIRNCSSHMVMTSHMHIQFKPGKQKYQCLSQYKRVHMTALFLLDVAMNAVATVPLPPKECHWPGQHDVECQGELLCSQDTKAAQYSWLCLL